MIKSREEYDRLFGPKTKSPSDLDRDQNSERLFQSLFPLPSNSVDFVKDELNNFREDFQKERAKCLNQIDRFEKSMVQLLRYLKVATKQYFSRVACTFVQRFRPITKRISEAPFTTLQSVREELTEMRRRTQNTFNQLNRQTLQIVEQVSKKCMNELIGMSRYLSVSVFNPGTSSNENAPKQKVESKQGQNQNPEDIFSTQPLISANLIKEELRNFSECVRQERDKCHQKLGRFDKSMFQLVKILRGSVEDYFKKVESTFLKRAQAIVPKIEDIPNNKLKELSKMRFRTQQELQQLNYQAIQIIGQVQKQLEKELIRVSKCLFSINSPINTNVTNERWNPRLKNEHLKIQNNKLVSGLDNDFGFLCLGSVPISTNSALPYECGYGVNSGVTKQIQFGLMDQEMAKFINFRNLWETIPYYYISNDLFYINSEGIVYGGGQKRKPLFGPLPAFPGKPIMFAGDKLNLSYSPISSKLTLTIYSKGTKVQIQLDVHLKEGRNYRMFVKLTRQSDEVELYFKERQTESEAERRRQRLEEFPIHHLRPEEEQNNKRL